LELPLFKSLGIHNILSYGDAPVEIELKPLNVLIGPNGSGKSNFIECFRLLKAAPSDLSQPISEGGGIGSWLWKGSSEVLTATLFVSLQYDDDAANKLNSPFASKLSLHERDHQISFTSVQERIGIIDEQISSSDFLGKQGTVYEYRDKQPYLRVVTANDITEDDSIETMLTRIVDDAELKKVDVKSLKRDQSIISQRNDPDVYPVLHFLAEQYSKIHIYADTNFGRSAPARKLQNADLDYKYLFEDASNLALVINDLQNRPAVMRDIVDRLKLFYPRVRNIITRVSFGTVQIFLEEEGLHQTIPATRISDGTLKYLCLLVILCHPEPPPLICIEEPEVGMHPDMIRSIAQLLIEASQRTQIVITTHSDLLVSALSEVPESIIVCERDDTGTKLKRLESEKMKDWLERYSLGELWLKGEIGGTRW
jgi:predicted ATPase